MDLTWERFVDERIRNLSAHKPAALYEVFAPSVAREVLRRLELFVKRMGLLLEKRKNEATRAAMRVRSEANKHGTLHSSRTDLGVKSAYEETYDEFCGDAWSELHHIAVTVGVKPGENLVDELRAVFDEVMLPLAERYIGELAGKRSTAGAISGDIVGDAEAAFARSREIVGTEIELFSSNTEMIVSQSGGNVHIQHYTFSGPIGAVQQGEHSTATVTQHFDSAGLEALRSALESLLEKFRDHERLEPLIEESKAEAAKSQPRLGRLRSLLTEIKAWIGVAKEGKEIFETVESAAVECGMDALPPIPL